MAVADFDKLADDFVVLEQVAVVVDLDELADLEVEVAVVLLFDEFADFVVEVVVVALLRVVALGLEEPVDFVVPDKKAKKPDVVPLFPKILSPFNDIDFMNTLIFNVLPTSGPS